MPSELVFSKCKRCGRTIKNSKAQAIGYGAICLKKHKAEVEQELKKGLKFGECGQASLTLFVF